MFEVEFSLISMSKNIIVICLDRFQCF